MDSKKIALIIVVVVLVAVAIYFVARNMNVVATTQGVYLPTQDQLSQASPGWKLISLGEVNDTFVVQQTFPGADSYYQEYILSPTSNQTAVAITVVHYPGSPQVSNLSLPHYLINHYLILVNVTGNSSPVDLAKFLNLEVQVMMGRNGTQVKIPPYMYPSSKGLNLVQYYVLNVTSPEGNFTQYSEYLLGNSSSVNVAVLTGQDATQLYNYLYGTTGHLAINGTLSGYRYFNLTVNSTFSSIYYNVGLKGNNVVLVQAQGQPAFNIFQYVMERV